MEAVFRAIAGVMADLAKVGVGKNQINPAQKFRYRGIDDVYNALAPAMARHGLAMLPTVEERLVAERRSSNGGVLFSVVLRVRYTFVAAEDGSTHDIVVYGEAMDSGDKATNKAMTAAFKYAAIQTFCIPIVGADDPDSETHEVVAAAPASTAPVAEPPPPAAPAIVNDDVMPELRAAALAAARAQRGSVIRSFLASRGVDRIGALDIEAQAELLRVLESEVK